MHDTVVQWTKLFWIDILQQIFLYGSCKKGLHYTWSKFGNRSDTKYEKLFWKRRVTVGVLFCKETLYMPEEVFVNILTRISMRKTYNCSCH